MRAAEHRLRLTDDGLLIDAREWEPCDWHDLHEAIEQIKRRIAARHRARVAKERKAEEREE